ncbi:MAG TPA: hypothetical protein VF478_03730 [Anaerolineae bacterium]
MILQFRDISARTAFLDRMTDTASAVKLRLKPSYAQPTVVMVQGVGDVPEQRLKMELLPHLNVDNVDVKNSIQADGVKPSSIVWGHGGRDR